MPDIAFHAVTRDGTPGKHLGTVSLVDGVVKSTPGVAAETVAMLARRHNLTESAVAERLLRDGWSNGHVIATTA